MALALAEAEKFLIHEARLLDEARYDEWLALFTEDGWYWVPIEYGQKSPFDTVSLIYDDRRLLETRVRRLSNPSMHSQNPPSRASRIIANVTVEEGADDAVTIRSKFSMVEYRRNEQRFFAGTCFHRLVGTGAATRIAWKRVDLVNCEAELEGLVLPF